MVRLFFGIGAAFGLLGVAAGAFAAHGLRERLEPRMLEVFETAARYQLIHALALIAVAWAATRWPGAAVTAAGASFIAGILIFSGSLYALSLTGLRWLGAITPLGGFALIVGWACLIWAAFSNA